jgi:hypothetical protein
MDVANAPAAKVDLILSKLVCGDVSPCEDLVSYLIATVEEQPRPDGDLRRGDDKVNAP